MYSSLYTEVYKPVETIIKRPTNIFCKLQILVKEINPLCYTEKTELQRASVTKRKLSN